MRCRWWLDRVLMTPFRMMVVPPPMSAFYLQMSAPVSQVSFCHSTQSSNDIAVLLCTGQLFIYIMTPCNVFDFLYFYCCWCYDDIVNSKCSVSHGLLIAGCSFLSPIVSLLEKQCILPYKAVASTTTLPYTRYDRNYQWWKGLVFRQQEMLVGQRLSSQLGLRLTLLLMWCFPAIWNWLPDSMRDPAISRDSFRRSLKMFLFSAYLCTQRIKAFWTMRSVNLLTYLLTVNDVC